MSAEHEDTERYPSAKFTFQVRRPRPAFAVVFFIQAHPPLGLCTDFTDGGRHL